MNESVDPKQKCSVPLPIMRARSDEVTSVFALFAIQQELEKAEARMNKRIHTIPGGLRDLRMIRAVVSKLCDNLVATLPEEKRISMIKNLPHMSYEVYFNRHICPLDDGWESVSSSDLDLITSIAHSFCCFGCDKSCNRCELGKAFDRIKVQSRRRDESWEMIDFECEHAAGEVVSHEDDLS